MKKLHVLVLCCLSCFPVALMADASLGSVAGNLLDPVGLFSDFVDSGCVILGASFLFASIIKYAEHKRSPLMVPISTVVFLLIAGVILLALPFLYLLTGYGVPFTFFKS